jgi:hypothetical protein
LLGIGYGAIFFMAFVSIGLAIVPPVGPLIAAAVTLALLALAAAAKYDYD